MADHSTEESTRRPEVKDSDSRWAEQAMRYARDLSQLYEDERRKTRELRGKIDELHTLQEQTVAFAHDLKVTHEAERALRRQIEEAYVQTIRMLAAAVEARDPYTGGHIERVTGYCGEIARELGWNEERLVQVELGAVLHDIGKIAVEDHILRKPGPLAEDEWLRMREHPNIGAQLLQGIQFLQFAVSYALCHHERFDGSGYPNGLSGQLIPIEGRLVAVADAFDAMTSDRPYRRGLSIQEACDEITRGRGRQFDPQMVDAFLAAFSRIAPIAAQRRAPNGSNGH